MLLLATLPSSDKIYTALAGLAFAVLLLVIDMVRDAVKQWRETRRKIKQSSFAYLAEKQVQIDQATERMVHELKADNVSLYRLHNGEFFEGNDSIKKMTMVSEAVSGRGVARWKGASLSMLLSNYPHLVLGLDGPTKQPYYLLTPENALDFEAGRLLNEREYETCVVLLIRGKKDKPLAMLWLCWCTRKLTLSDLDATLLESHRRDFSFALSD
jgi:hypothetical protein